MMIEKIAWEIFKNTGNINTMMELLELDKQKGLQQNLSNINLNEKNLKGTQKNLLI